MDRIIDAIIKFIPFAAAFGYWGVSKDLITGLESVLGAIIFYFLTELYKKWHTYHQNKKIASNLYPYFDYLKVKHSRKFFIPTQGQNNSPTNEEEIQQSTRFIVKKQLIPWFLDVAFNEKKETDKFYLILADSGMGKTTFMINLYFKYNSKWNKKYKIRLIPFGDDRIIKHLEELAGNQEEAKHTILLLDAFDEYKGLLPPDIPDGLSDDERFRKRLDEIVELTRDFRDVVITTRTQYFPGQEDRPYELKIPCFDDKGFHTLAKLYLSPFDNKEITHYLNKKFGILKFWNDEKKLNARRIIETAPKLMVRPMLLAYIDYLVKDPINFKTTYQIYDTLISKWLEREAKKRKHKNTLQEKFKNDLYAFSKNVALKIYENFYTKGILSIDKEAAIFLCKKENLDLQDYEITGQSLLIRDAYHNWKFAHKSILEFFLAKQCVKDRVFATKIQFIGMDMVKTFYEEFGIEPVTKYILIRGGTFKMNEKYPIKVSDFYMSKYLLTQAEYIKITERKNPSAYKNDEQNPVEQISWYEAIEYCNLLNQNFGYNLSYDSEGNLLDSKGKTTNDITLVKGFRLPTEAEWEYAAGGGENNRTVYAGTNSEKDLIKYAWFVRNDQNTHPVGELCPNQLGLYDMSGNVWEWCYDWYDEDFFKRSNEKTIVENPVNNAKSSFHVYRGGSLTSNAENCRVTCRINDPSYHFKLIGFRLVFAP